MKKPKKHEATLWSIGLSGFGQFLNGSLFKGSLFIFLEFLINGQSNKSMVELGEEKE